MQYTFTDNMKQRSAGFPFTVEFEHDSFCDMDGYATVHGYDYENGEFIVEYSVDSPKTIIDCLDDEMQMHLTGDAYID